MDLKNLPPEVIEAMIATSGYGTFYCGLEQYNRINNTIKKYPTYFPWENKYNSIPQQVHDEYQALIGKLNEEIYPKEEKHINILPGEGIFSYSIRKQPIETDFSAEKFKEVLQEIFFNIPEKRKKFEKGKAKIWKKVYGKYKLEYNERKIR
jgi:hypothetical protein